ncbi:N-acetylglucosamine-6-phosphate deacetylase [Wilcoxina mikolae CBS 423.85]|nr:N-acetylglucosamine-6-phosphate deacetylase [Wilcoxina mikolae CBS 423.85]
MTSSSSSFFDNKMIKLTNCRLAVGDRLVPGLDLWISSATGRIIDQQHVFFSHRTRPSVTHDLGGCILAPGLIDVQLNGGYGFDFSMPSDDYREGFKIVNKQLVKTGVTSYLPTLTSQRPSVYQKTLPHLAAQTTRNPSDGSESLGAHCEGPFLNPLKNGIHSREVLQRPTNGIIDLETCYGPSNLNSKTIKMITLAPEIDKTTTPSIIKELSSRGIIVSAGHSNATYEEMWSAVDSGVTMVTHLFNAIARPHHRDPGIFGILGAQEGLLRPFYGIIADDIHVHPSFIRVAYNAHMDGTILVSDAMSMLGLPDGIYNWTNGEVIAKKGGKLTLRDTDTIAGSCVTLVECLNNFINWTGAPIASALRTVTETPAKMLGLEDVKGTLKPGADADLVVLSEAINGGGKITLTVERVYKFGVEVFGNHKAKL